MKVKMYNEEFEIDNTTGKGYDKVIKKISPLMYKMANRSVIKSHTHDDIYQELAIIVMDGCKKYTEDKNVKLSTFLHIHLHNKFISYIKMHNLQKHNASIMQENFMLPKQCLCGSLEWIDIKEGKSQTCALCETKFSTLYGHAKCEMGIGLYKYPGDNALSQKYGSDLSTSGFEAKKATCFDFSFLPKEILSNENFEFYDFYFKMLDSIDDPIEASIIKLTFEESMTQKEISEALDIPISHVAKFLMKLQKNPIVKEYYECK